MSIELFNRLDDEWTWISATPGAARAVVTWKRRHPALAPFHDAAAVVDFVQRRDQADANDRVHAALVRLAADDDLAARVMLQAVLPGLKALTMTFRMAGDSLDDVASTVMTAAVQKIRTYPCERRPRRVAANILLDTRQAVSRSLCRPTVPVIPLIQAPWSRVNAGIEREPSIELRLLLDEAVERGIVTDEERRLIELTRLSGITFSELTGTSGAPAARLRQRRLRAEASLRASLA